MLSRPLLLAASLITSSLALLGCDPGAPGAHGEAVLGLPVNAAKFQSLEMRAMIAEGDFDVNAPVFPDLVVGEDAQMIDESGGRSGSIEDGNDRGTTFYQGSMPVESASFPLEYSVGGQGIGYTSEGRWRLFMWLSEDAGSHLEKRPPSGVPYGVTDFDAEGCGLMGGYCGFTPGVNVFLDQIAP
ncbi:MAG: hypothetical protein U0359_19150 [Byssovorax sp.]